MFGLRGISVGGCMKDLLWKFYYTAFVYLVALVLEEPAVMWALTP